MEKTTFKLCNVVWYDGTDAFVSKFILRSKGYDEVNEESREKVLKELDGNGDVLKIDILYEVSLDNIEAFAESNDTRVIYERFRDMWF